MARKRTTEATSEQGTEGNDVFDDVIAARAEEQPKGQGGEILPSAAEGTRLPEQGRAAAVGRKQYKQAADPRGELILDLSNDPNGPQARLLRSQRGNMWIQFGENPGREITSQLREAGFDWKGDASTDFAKGAWILPLDPDRKWQGHAHAQEVFYDLVNQVRATNGLAAFVPGAAQSAG